MALSEPNRLAAVAFGAGFLFLGVCLADSLASATRTLVPGISGEGLEQCFYVAAVLLVPVLGVAGFELGLWLLRRGCLPVPLLLAGIAASGCVGRGFLAIDREPLRLTAFSGLILSAGALLAWFPAGG
ncbi:MAG: hypothetical protein V2A76_04415, partial [Planctomycetota bacterium]